MCRKEEKREVKGRAEGREGDIKEEEGGKTEKRGEGRRETGRMRNMD